jgi:phosphonate metabolism-associated iron-containing alcohol dehydrogenase
MNNFSYHNPVKVHFGNGLLNELPEILGNRKALLVTMPFFETSGVVERIQSLVPGRINRVIHNVPENPHLEYLENVYGGMPKGEYDVILALGGGSVIDTAKTLAVNTPQGDFKTVENLIRGTVNPEDYSLTPVIAVPTTAGTGSEVTPWATVWDTREAKKYSLHLPDLWCEQCICDPELTLTLPEPATIHTALDALSHSLESVWNINRNPVSTRFAVASVQLILQTLPLLAWNSDEILYRKKMMLASLYAGLAFSNTKTAVAHAVSYALTAEKGLPHGLACGVTLPSILDAMLGENREIDAVFEEMFGMVSSRPLREMFEKIGLSASLKDYGVSREELEAIRKNLASVPRAGNSLVPVGQVFENFYGEF